jgi:hypothetical protein
METAKTAEPAATFDEIWAILRKNAESMEEFNKGMDKLKERQEESARRMEEYDRRFKEDKEAYNRRIGHMENLFDEIAEYMVAPKLCEKFREHGLKFLKANPNGSYINDRDNQIFLEIDIMLENSEKAMLIEVKAKITAERVNKHIERLEKMRK